MSVEDGVEDYTQDGTVDRKGKPVLRSTSGGWKACSFVVVHEVLERMAFYGIASNLFTYLSTRLHQGTVTDSSTVANWAGTVWTAPILGAYLADAHLGRYKSFVCGILFYVLGLFLLTLSTSLPSLVPPPCTTANVTHCVLPSELQLGVFKSAIYVLAIGTGIIMPNIVTMGADQFDEFEAREKAHKPFFFNIQTFSIYLGTLFANTVLVWIPAHCGWSLGFGLPFMLLLASLVPFFSGRRFYRHRLPNGSPFTRMSKVIVAAIRNWNVTLPSDPKELYELDSSKYEKKGKFKIDSTSSLRFLNRACVKTHSSGPWNLCPVTQVEETKQMLRMIPILIAMFVPNTMVAQVNTLFVKQGATLSRSMGSFNIPPASLAAFVTMSSIIGIALYDLVIVKCMRRITKNPRGITLLQRIGIGLVLHIVTMVVASFTETYRLGMAKDNSLDQKAGPVQCTIFILLPQLVLMGIADAFWMAGRTEFFYDQAPQSMKSLGTSYSMTSVGIGNFLSNFLLSTMNKISSRNGQRPWIQDDLNTSRLDYYYAFFAFLNSLNFILFLLVSRFYIYRAEVRGAVEAPEGKELSVISRAGTSPIFVQRDC